MGHMILPMILLVLLSPQPSKRALDMAGAIVELGSLESDPTTKEVFEKERRVAEKLKKLCDSYLKDAPELSPIQREWLDEKIRGEDTWRDAVRSPEYARKHLNDKFTDCVAGAGIVIKAGPEHLDLRLLGWLAVVGALGDPRLQDYMTQSGREALKENELVDAWATVVNDLVDKYLRRLAFYLGKP